MISSVQREKPSAKRAKDVRQRCLAQIPQLQDRSQRLKQRPFAKQWGREGAWKVETMLLLVSEEAVARDQKVRPEIRNLKITYKNKPRTTAS